eukprot:NODE_5538_length_1759_cov_11.096814.p1 GENE.NODE_5538_length_1759_cov_11.096814~~NODE_5538_length_1759_cov_11.096814.p1  ORF type:complete len:418 (-),score=99.23 NODE_5538_length_1759_cov_11.096814:504-1604(-)
MMTLLINATTCGALVRKLGLTRRSEAKESLMKHFQKKMHKSVRKDLQRLHGLPMYQDADNQAVSAMVSSLFHTGEDESKSGEPALELGRTLRDVNVFQECATVIVEADVAPVDSTMLSEARVTFYALLKSEYWKMIEENVLPHDSMAATMLLESLDAAICFPKRTIHDFEVVMQLAFAGHGSKNKCLSEFARCRRDMKDGIGFGSCLVPVRRGLAKFDLFTIICCMDAHRQAQQTMTDIKLKRALPIWAPHQAAIAESAEQVVCIEQFLIENKLRLVDDHHNSLEALCRTKQLAFQLLTHQEEQVEDWVSLGLLSEGEKEELLEDHANDATKTKQGRAGWMTEQYSDNTMVICALEEFAKRAALEE